MKKIIESFSKPNDNGHIRYEVSSITSPSMEFDILMVQHIGNLDK